MKNGKTLKKVSKIVLVVLLIIFLLVLINFIPTFSLKTSDMNVIEGQWVNVYYEEEESAAEDVFQYADSETSAIAQKLGFDTKQDMKLYTHI
jgi:hypothetical protein